MSISQQIPDAIKRTSRAIGYAAWLDTSDAWTDLPKVIAARFTTGQRVGLAYAAMRALSEHEAAAVAEAVLPERTSPPIPHFMGYMDEAAFWADMAEPEALDAYCLASFQRMAAPRQAAFLDFIQGRAAA